MKRIAVISQQGDRASGAEHALLEFLERLPERIAVDWLFFEDGEFADVMRRRFASVTIVPMSEKIARTGRSALRLGAVTDAASLVLRLRRQLAMRRPDVVITNSMKAHVAGSLAARLAGLRCVNYVHDLVEGNALRLLKIVSRTCAEARLTCSEAVAAQLRLPSTTVAYAAIDTARFKSLPERDIARCELGLPAGVPVIGLVGRIARWKGQDRFIRIAASVLANQEAHFCIVGSAIFGCDEAYVTELHSTVVAYGLADRFSFVPWQKDMARVYAALDLSCNCSDREPFGRTSLEALASGVPIVCFDDAGVCEVLPGGRCAAVVAAGDERGFADAVEA
ncbi:MAG: glycosyltransferase family 4 protein, partial [Candidatus Velthaea sp.]